MSDLFFSPTLIPQTCERAFPLAEERPLRKRLIKKGIDVEELSRAYTFKEVSVAAITSIGVMILLNLHLLR